MSAPRRGATAFSLSLWQQVKEAAIPVAAYWAMLLVSFATLAAVVIAEDPGVGTVGVVLLLAVITVAGVGLGQVLAFARVRSWVVLLFGAMCWGAGAVLGVALAGVMGEVAALVGLVLFFLPIALTGGLWSLETHRAVWSTWLPVMYTSISVIVWAEARGNDAAWHAGDKWAIWDLLTLSILGVTLVLSLVYLVARETHRLALWRRGPRAPLAPTIQERGAARPRLSIGGGCLLLVLAGVLTITTAAVSPYLWRTAPADQGDQPDPVQPQDPPPPPEEGCEKEPESGPGTPPPDPQGAEEMMEKVVEAGQKAAGALCSVLTLALLAVLGVLIGGPPLRRLVVVRHLRDPLWSVSPTTRIEQGWRLVEIAMGDAGVPVFPHEDARGLARRAAPVLAKLSPVEVHGLEDAAAVADRVRFGLGVSPGDVEVMERFSAWAYDTVWERLDDKEQVRCMYRGL